MSTQDESLMKAFEDPKGDQTPPQADPQSVDAGTPDSAEDAKADSPENAKPEEVKEDSPTPNDSEDKKPETPASEETLTPAVKAIVDNFSKLSDEEKFVKLDKLKKSNRSDQLEAVKALENIFDLSQVEDPEPEVKEEDESTEIDQEMIDAAVQRQMEAMGVSQAVESFNRSAEETQRNQEIDAWSKENNLELNSQDITSNVIFLKAFHSLENKGLPLKQRTRLALFESQNNSEVIPTTANPVGTPPKSEVVPAGDEDSLKSWLAPPPIV